MRLTASWSIMLVLAAAVPAAAQEWTDFVSREDGFRVNVPGTPKVAETTYYDNDYPPPPRTGGTGAVITGGGPDPNVTPRAR